MNIVNNLRGILEYYNRSRGVGHTTAVMRGTYTPAPVAVLAVDQHHVKNLAGMIDHRNDVSVLTLQDLVDGHYRRGKDRPLLIDNYTTMVICSESINAIDTANARAAELKRKLNEHRDSIASLESKVAYLESQIAANLEHQIEHAAGNLPEGWQIRIDVENGSASVTVIQPDGTEECMSDGEADIAEEFSYAGQYVFDGIRGEGETTEN